MTQDRFSSSRSSFTTLAAAAFFLIAGLFVAGCGSGPRGPGPSLAAASAPRPVAMQGEAKFFDGQLVATISISRGFERGGGRGGEGGGGGGGRGRGRRNNDQYEEIDLPDPDDKDYAESISKIMQLQIRGSPLPPVTLRLALSNPTPQPIDVDISEVNSDLGNFAVQPEKLTIPAGKSAEPYPMNSQLGLVGDNFPVKVSLRIGDKTESQIITVQSLFNPDGTRK
jgi:hypothetical protein